MPGKIVRVRLSSWRRPASGVVAGIAGGAEDANAEDAVGGLRDDVGVGLEDRAQVPARSLCLALCLCDDRHHAGFGAVGDHADDVEEELLAFGKRIQGLVLVELGDGDVSLRVAARLLERLTLGVESVDPGLETSGGFGGLVRLGSPWPDRRSCCAGCRGVAGSG